MPALTPCSLSELPGDRGADHVGDERDQQLHLEAKQHAEVVRVAHARPVPDEAGEDHAEEDSEAAGERAAR